MNRKVKSLMVFQGLQNKHVAKKARVTCTWVSLVVCGHRKSARIQGLIAEILGLPYSEVWGEKNKAA